MKNIIVGITEEQKEQIKEQSIKVFGNSNVSGFVRYLINNALNDAEPTKVRTKEERQNRPKKAQS